eukprot:jgi/Undpi1/9826/HiC_scaffold_27.g12280.m1
MGAVAYLVVANPSSRNNLGTLIRCAAAFGVEEVVVVGESKWSTHGAHGSHKHVKYRCFGDWESAATFLRLEAGCDLSVVGMAVEHDAEKRSQERSEESSEEDQKREDEERPEERSGDNQERVEEISGKDQEQSEERSGKARERRRVDVGTSECEYSSECFTSTAIRDRPFRRSTAFLVGHRNRLEAKALSVCDFLVHVEQVRSEEHTT